MILQHICCIHVPIPWHFFTNFYIPWSTGMLSIRGFGAGHLEYGNTVGRRLVALWW